MKRLFAYSLILLFLVSTIGVNLSIQICGGELVSMRINDINITADTSDDMNCCTSDDEGCLTCEHHNHSYKITQKYVLGQIVSLKPALKAVDWFHGDLISLLYYSFIPVEEGGDKAEYYYQSPYHSCLSLSHRGLRAPPVYCL